VAPAIAQSVSGGGFVSGGSPFGTTLGSNTGAGNYLLAAFTFTGNPGTLTGTIITSFGFSLINKFVNGNTNLVIYELVNAASIPNSSVLSFQPTNAGAHAFTFLEITGADTVTPRDGSPATNSGTSTSPLGGSFTSSVATELILTFLGITVAGANGTFTFSSPTGGTGVAIAKQATGNNGIATPRDTAGICALSLGVTSIGTYALGATSSLSQAWEGVAIGIQGPSSPSTPVETWIRRNVTETRYRDTGELVTF
jgi:hypothetical protein